MGTCRGAVIVYEGLPLSSGGAHVLRTHDPRLAWEQVRSFLRACTDDAAPESLSLTSWKRPNKHRAVRPADVEAVVGRLAEGGFREDVVLDALWHVRLLDPATGEVLPHQGPAEYAQQWLLGGPFGMTRVGAHFGHRSTVAINLCLPFEDVDERVIALARAYESRLPFRLSSRHWSRWHLNRDATGYYPRKVTVL